MTKENRLHVSGFNLDFWCYFGCTLIKQYTMRFFVFFLLFITTVIDSTAQKKAARKYISNMSNFEFRGWKIKKGTLIKFSNGDSATVKSISRYSVNDTDVIFLKLKTQNGNVDFDVLNEIYNGNIILPTGISNVKSPTTYLNAYTRDTTIKEWKLGILPMKDGKVIYSAVIELPNTSKEELYKRAKLWFAKAFRDSKEVLQIDDKEGGKIVGKGVSTVYWTYSGLASSIDVSLWQLFDVSIKEHKIRIVITDIYCRYYVPSTAYTSGASLGFSIEDWATKNNGKVVRHANTTKFFESVDNNIQTTINSFESFLKDPELSTNGKDDNW